MKERVDRIKELIHEASCLQSGLSQLAEEIETNVGYATIASSYCQDAGGHIKNALSCLNGALEEYNQLH